MNRNRNETQVDRLTGSLELKYQAAHWLHFLNRTGLDRYTDGRSAMYPLQSPTFLTGAYRDEVISETQFNNDFIVQATKDLNGGLGRTLLAGFNLNHREAEQVGAQVTNLLNPFSPPQLQNSSINSRSPFNANTVIPDGGFVWATEPARPEYVVLFPDRQGRNRFYLWHSSKHFLLPVSRVSLAVYATILFAKQSGA